MWVVIEGFWTTVFVTVVYVGFLICQGDLYGLGSGGREVCKNYISTEVKYLRIVLGDAVSTLQTFVWILNHVSRSITWSLFTLKASNLVK